MTTKRKSAKMYLYSSDTSGPCLSGNKIGLSHVSETLSALSHSKIPGEHVHFFADNDIFCTGSQPLTIYYEDDEWFDKYARETDSPIVRADDIPHRALIPEKLCAFMIATEIPPEMNVRKGKIYKIISVDPYPDADAWQKTIREDTGRMIIVSFFNEKNEIEKCGFDCDDKEINFFESSDLEQLLE
jgi:hypothetical protein